MIIIFGQGALVFADVGCREVLSRAKVLYL